MLRHVLKNEWRTMRAERALLPVALVMLALIAYGLFNGASWVDFQKRSIADVRADEKKRMAKLRRNLAAIEEGREQPKGFQDPRSGGAIGGATGVPYLVKEPGPLAALSIGQSDLYPYYFKASLRSKQTVMSNDEIENPVNLLSGRFDLAFVLVYLYPLLILAFSYDILSREKEQGTLALTLANPVPLRTVILGKIVARALVVMGLAVGITVAGALLAGVDLGAAGAVERLAMWVLVVMAYGAFWFVLAVAVNTLGKDSAANAMMLAGAWLGLAILIPAALHMISSTLYPVPSRVEMIQAMRNAGKEATARGSQLLARYLEDHPELAPPGDAKRPDFASTTYAVQQEVDRNVAPVMARFEQQVESQQALVDRFGYLSPAVLAQNAFNDLAGSGLGAHQHFVAQGERFLKAWQQYFFPRIFARKLLASSDLDRMPKFAFEPESTGVVLGRAVQWLTGLAIPLGLLVWLAAVGLKRYRLAN